MIRITVEDIESDIKVVGQFSFCNETDGSAFDYVRRSADRVARQLFLTPVGVHLTLSSDKSPEKEVPINTETTYGKLA